MSKVFRVEKNKNFTTVSNHHLKDRTLSLKAKGLLTLMLSLPDEWDYSEMGLVTLSKDNRNSVRTTLKELEESYYLTRYRERDNKGKLRNVIYHIYEKPTQQKPMLDKPTLEKPMLENHTQLNTNVLNTKESNTYISISEEIDLDELSKEIDF